MGCYMGLSTMTVFVAKCKRIVTIDRIKWFLIFAGDRGRGSQCVEMERGVAYGQGDHHGVEWVESFSYVKTRKNSVPGYIWVIPQKSGRSLK